MDNHSGFEIWQFIIYNIKLYTGEFSGNSAVVFYLKYPPKVLNINVHLVLELR